MFLFIKESLSSPSPFWSLGNSCCDWQIQASGCYIFGFSGPAAVLLSFGKRACKVFARICEPTDPSWSRLMKGAVESFCNHPGVNWGQIWDLEAWICPFRPLSRFWLQLQRAKYQLYSLCEVQWWWVHFWIACQSRFLWGVGRTQGGRGRIARQKYLVDLGRVGVL